VGTAGSFEASQHISYPRTNAPVIRHALPARPATAPDPAHRARAKRSYTTSKKIQHRDGVDGDTKYGARLSRTTSTLRGIRQRIKKQTEDQRRQRYPCTCNDGRWPADNDPTFGRNERNEERHE